VYYKVDLIIPAQIFHQVEDELYQIATLGWEEKEAGTEKWITIYLREKAVNKLELIERLITKHPQIKTSYTLIEEENWAELWKENFKPLKVGKRLVIVPPWEKYEPEEKEVIILIEPGQAFGTGHHPTTQMMLEAIEEFFGKQEKGSIKVLDVGCGTGILSIACVLLSPEVEVSAIDIDEEALKATLYNARLNNVENRIKVFSSLTEVNPEEKYQLVLANIGFKELKNLAEPLKRYATSEGTLYLLSGVLKEDLPALKKIYQDQGYQPAFSKVEKEWSLLAVKLP
jgi:ribosomal protein L11 methyltransferase